MAKSLRLCPASSKVMPLCPGALGSVRPDNKSGLRGGRRFCEYTPRSGNHYQRRNRGHEWRRISRQVAGNVVRHRNLCADRRYYQAVHYAEKDVRQRHYANGEVTRDSGIVDLFLVRDVLLAGNIA